MHGVASTGKTQDIAVAEKEVHDARSQAVEAEALVHKAAEQVVTEEAKAIDAERKAQNAASVVAAKERQASGAEMTLSVAKSEVARAEEALRGSAATAAVAEVAGNAQQKVAAADKLKQARATAARAEADVRNAVAEVVADEKNVVDATQIARSAATVAAQEEKRAAGAEAALTASKQKAAQAENMLESTEESLVVKENAVAAATQLNAEAAPSSTSSGKVAGAVSAVLETGEKIVKKAKEQAVETGNHVKQVGEDLAGNHFMLMMFVLVFGGIVMAILKKAPLPQSIYKRTIAEWNLQSSYIGGDDFQSGGAHGRTFPKWDVESQLDAMCGSTR
eukprot:TRINITY_DN17325_c0_g1_i2.p1 TRINITY_DN17325_c0_g1~~TRINITY_DN17325_c0_g1_i2.p1  ORF type:complete len:335 (-),score=97.59 TRINITY_DN17325_c0_g1_i2:225-1229(-)